MLGYSLICVKQFEYLAWLSSSFCVAFRWFKVYTIIWKRSVVKSFQQLSVQLHKVFSCAKLCSEPFVSSLLTLTYFCVCVWKFCFWGLQSKELFLIA